MTRAQPADLALPDAALPARTRRPDHASVLVVEDSAFDRRRVTRLCRDLGLTVTITCVDCLAAMRTALDKSRFDLVLLDFTLPDGEGERGLELIAASPRNRRTATIVITAREEPEVMQRAMALGAVDFIRKSDLTAGTMHRAALNALQKSGLMQTALAEAEARRNMGDGLRELGRELGGALTEVLADMAYRIDRLDREIASPAAEAELILLRKGCARIAERLGHLSDPPEEVIARIAQRQVAQIGPSPVAAPLVPRLFGPRAARTPATPPPQVFVAPSGPHGAPHHL